MYFLMLLTLLAQKPNIFAYRTHVGMSMWLGIQAGIVGDEVLVGNEVEVGGRVVVAGIVVVTGIVVVAGWVEVDGDVVEGCTT